MEGEGGLGQSKGAKSALMSSQSAPSSMSLRHMEASVILRELTGCSLIILTQPTTCVSRPSSCVQFSSQDHYVCTGTFYGCFLGSR